MRYLKILPTAIAVVYSGTDKVNLKKNMALIFVLNKVYPIAALLTASVPNLKSPLMTLCEFMGVG